MRVFLNLSLSLFLLSKLRPVNIIITGTFILLRWAYVRFGDVKLTRDVRDTIYVAFSLQRIIIVFEIGVGSQTFLKWTMIVFLLLLIFCLLILDEIHDRLKNVLLLYFVLKHALDVLSSKLDLKLLIFA
jgi:hypothetical protein